MQSCVQTVTRGRRGTKRFGRVQHHCNYATSTQSCLQTGTEEVVEWSNTITNTLRARKVVYKLLPRGGDQKLWNFHVHGACEVVYKPLLSGGGQLKDLEWSTLRARKVVYKPLPNDLE